jgi:hypothetical protein
MQFQLIRSFPLNRFIDLCPHETTTIKLRFILQLSLIGLVFFPILVFGQVEGNDLSNFISGKVLNANNEPLPYTTIYLKRTQTGTISNEDGNFTLKLEGINQKDSVRFQYIGFEDKNLTVEYLSKNPTIILEEKVSLLGELTVFGLPPDPETIVKKVLEKAPSNYSQKPFKKQLFVRQRSYQKITNIALDHKRSSIDVIDSELFNDLQEKVPKFMTWYTDFLGNVYKDQKEEDLTFKVVPQRVVALKQEDYTELEYIEKIFTDLAQNTKEGEYWKIKTGILSTKIDLGVEDSTNAVPEGQQQTKYFTYSIKTGYKFTTFENEDHWEFLHKPGKYEFTLIGGSRFKGENVYIIDFEPKRSGTLSGRVYISTDTYALVRADYQYAPGKTGTDFSILGVSYTKSGFEASITFEKVEEKYQLTYFSKRETQAYGVDRKISLIKKRERFLFDKELEEIKLGLDLTMEDETSTEVFGFTHQNISSSDFEKVEQPEYMKVIYVDQFDDQLWKGYSIIEPTKQMRNYKKSSL